MATEQERNRGAGAYSTPGVDTPSKPGEFQSAATGPYIRFKLQDIDPPSSLYVTRDDRFSLRVRNSATGVDADVLGRILRAQDGKVVPFTWRFVPTTDRSANVFEFDLTEGYLLSMIIRAGIGATRKGQMFCDLRFIEGSGALATQRGTILAGYCNQETDLIWPTSTPIYSVDGEGMLRSITGTVPAAGADITEVVPTGARWRLKTATALFTPSAAVANRTPRLVLDDGANTLFISPNTVTVAATIVTRYVFAPGLNALNDAANNQQIQLPGDVPLFQGWRIRTSTTNIQAGDQWSALQYEVEEWIEQ